MNTPRADLPMHCAEPRQPVLAVLADDLSGAADCAATAAQYGASCRVLLDRGSAATATATAAAADASGRLAVAAHACNAARGSQTAQVVAVDLDSRRMTRIEAAACHAAQMQRLIAEGVGVAGRTTPVRVFKKVDSTLRGHLGAEIVAMMSDAGMAIIAPALPQSGRTTEQGRQLLHGVPVEQTEVWRNERLDGTGDLLQLFEREGVRVAHVDTSTYVRTHHEAPDRNTSTHTPLSAASAVSDAAVQALTAVLQQAREDGVRALVCDARTVADLRALALASVSMRNVFWVGSAGLARELTGVLAERGEFDDAAKASAGAAGIVGIAAKPESTGSMDDMQAAAASGNVVGVAATIRPGVLFVVGSMSSISHAQIAELASIVGEDLSHVVLAPSQMPAPTGSTGNPEAGAGAFSGATLAMPGANDDRHAATIASIEMALRAGRHVVVSYAQDDRVHAGSGLHLARALGRLLAPALQFAAGVFATGGETARALFDAAAIDALDLLEEIEPGVPLSLAARPVSRDAAVRVAEPLLVVTKAGAFGTPQTMVRVWQRLAPDHAAIRSDTTSPSAADTFSQPAHRSGRSIQSAVPERRVDTDAAIFPHAATLARVTQ